MPGMGGLRPTRELAVLAFDGGRGAFCRSADVQPEIFRPDTAISDDGSDGDLRLDEQDAAGLQVSRSTRVKPTPQIPRPEVLMETHSGIEHLCQGRPPSPAERRSAWLERSSWRPRAAWDEQLHSFARWLADLAVRNERATARSVIASRIWKPARRGDQSRIIKALTQAFRPGGISFSSCKLPVLHVLVVELEADQWRRPKLLMLRDLYAAVSPPAPMVQRVWPALVVLPNPWRPGGLPG